MASAFGHLLASGTLSHILARGTGGTRATRRNLPRTFWLFTLLSGVIPDLDVIAFKYGIPYQHPLGHRGFSHSILFALIWASLLTLLFFRKQVSRVLIFLILLVSTISHGLLDAMTNAGLGVGFFIPFDNTRYFFPFRPIETSPIKVERFFVQANKILTNEAYWIGIPCVLLIIASYSFICLRKSLKK